jgi:hypothetical protein
MSRRRRLRAVIAWVLGLSATFWVALLGGFASDLLT